MAAGAARHGNTQVVLDRTGVGDGVLDMFRERDVWPVPITITGGQSVMYLPDGTYTVPHTQLINKLDVAYQAGRPAFNPDLPTLREFEEVRSESTGALSYRQVRSSKMGHADLVLAASMALFFRNHYYSNVDIQAWEYWRQRMHAPPEDVDIFEHLLNTPGDY